MVIFLVHLPFRGLQHGRAACPGPSALPPWREGQCLPQREPCGAGLGPRGRRGRGGRAGTEAGSVGRRPGQAAGTTEVARRGAPAGTRVRAREATLRADACPGLLPPATSQLARLLPLENACETGARCGGTRAARRLQLTQAADVTPPAHRDPGRRANGTPGAPRPPPRTGRPSGAGLGLGLVSRCPGLSSRLCLHGTVPSHRIGVGREAGPQAAPAGPSGGQRGRRSRRVGGLTPRPRRRPHSPDRPPGAGPLRPPPAEGASPGASSVSRPERGDLCPPVSP